MFGNALAPIVDEFVSLLLCNLLAEHALVKLAVKAVVFVFFAYFGYQLLPRAMVVLAQVFHLLHLPCLHTHGLGEKGLVVHTVDDESAHCGEEHLGAHPAR